MASVESQCFTSPLVFTFAIVGHRAIDQARVGALGDRITRLIDSVGSQLGSAQAVSSIDQCRRLTLRFLSALAPGADQIGARAMLDRQARAKEGEAAWKLEAVLPFALEDYAHEIALDIRKRGGSTGEQEQAAQAMRELACKARRVLEVGDWMPGGGNPALDEHYRARRYATLGQLIVRQADLIVALWDGGPPGGMGGTADVVQEARRSGVPVVWIDPRDPATAAHSIVPDPRSAHVSVLDLVERRKAGDVLAHAAIITGETAAIQRAVRNVLLGADPLRAACVRRYLNDEATPMWDRSDWRGRRVEGTTSHGDCASVYGLMQWLMLLRARRVNGAALRAWPFTLGRRTQGPLAWLPCLFSSRYGFASGVEPEDEAARTATANDAPISPHAIRADAIATRRANQYRSVYVTIFALAALAVGWALAFVFNAQAKPLFVACELLTVAFGVIVFWRTRAQDPVRHGGKRWLAGRDIHQRWMDARLIAESQRGAQMLSWIGFAGRRPIEEQPASDHGHDHGHPAHGERTVWAPWFANAVSALPDLPEPDEGASAVLSPRRIARLSRAAGQVIAYQAGYHAVNHERLARLHHRLDQLSIFAIGLAFGISAAYLVLAWLHPYPGTFLHGAYYSLKNLAAFCGGVLPAAAAAAAGVRYHGDFERFALRSRETAARLAALGERAGRLAARAEGCGAKACAGQAPLYEPLLSLMLDTQAVLDEDLADWRFAYAARPITFG